MSEVKTKAFKIEVSLKIDSKDLSNEYSSFREEFSVNVTKTLDSTNETQKQEFLDEVKESVQEIWTKANKHLKNKDSLFTGEQNKDELAF